MSKLILTGAAALSLAIVGCGETPDTPPNVSSNAQIYAGTGAVTQLTGDRVTISHGPIEGLGCPAMTMGFQAPSPQMTQNIAEGDRVSFEFREEGGSYVLTSISKQ